MDIWEAGEGWEEVSKITRVSFGGKVHAGNMLHELADNPELDGVVVFCKWKNGDLTSGWSDMKCSEAALILLLAQQEIIEDSLFDD
mgnify:CR=1 FL=1